MLREFWRRRRNSVQPQTSYVYRPHVEASDFTQRVQELQAGEHPVVMSAVDNCSPAVVQNILQKASLHGLDFVPYEIDFAEYEHYVREAGYTVRYPDYYPDNLKEKSLEHYLSFKLLNITQEVFIDIASEHSPVPEIYARLSGAHTYSQDIMYPPGMQDNRIGGDAATMPIADGFAAKAALTCSLEHFEGDADTRLFQELARVLQPGGMVCVVPFYFFTEEAIQTDPIVSVPTQVVFDTGATIYCARSWGNRFGRFYSPASFIRRIMEPVKDKMHFTLYYLQNAAAYDASIYARFAFTATRV